MVIEVTQENLSPFLSFLESPTEKICGSTKKGVEETPVNDIEVGKESSNGVLGEESGWSG